MEKRKFGWPLLLIAVGVIFLLKNLGLIDLNIYELLFSWPMILVALGIVQLVDRSYVSGFILLFLGSVFMLPRLDIIQYGVMRVFWPIILIVIGTALLFRRRGISSSAEHYRMNPNPTDAQTGKHAAGAPIDANGFVRIDTLFSSSKTCLTDPVFRGAVLSCTFGGIDLDLRSCSLEAPEVSIDIDCTFGGITLRLPPTWRVESRIKSTFGGFDDKRPYPTGGTAAAHVVIIRGSATFSGVELR